MAEPAPATPPSMEAILASIKRIIDEPPAGPTPPIAAGPAPAAAEEDVLELGAAVEAAPPAAMIALAAEPMLVSEAARAASARAMAALATVTLDPHAGDHTLDGLVREMLRPMLKAWLDANLPDLVERVVTREIARLGGR